MTQREQDPFGPSSLQDNVFALFERHATATPDAVAVIDPDGAASYDAIAKRAEAVCRFLHAQGLAPEQPVGVLMHRRAELLAVLLGIWKSGGAYVPIDPSDPPDRVLRMLSSCGCTMMLGDRPLLDALLREAGSKNAASIAQSSCIGIDTIPPLTDDTAQTPTAPGDYRLAYLLFTSGSTGEPKAVAVEHRNVVNLLRSAYELLNFRQADRYLAVSTIAFDASITELFLPLTTGASLLLRDRKTLLDPKRLAADIREFGVSVVQTGPSVWSVLLAEVPDFPRVRVAITHGEAVDPALARRLCSYGDEVWNLYGPTETTVWATGQRLSPDSVEAVSTMSAPIGRPLAHVRAFVIDDQGHSVEDGVEGELCLRGPSVARGYHMNAELTGERFVRIDGERVYRTGDLVLRDGGGVLHYFGRNDDQMKIRGVRIEPSEVETAILRDPRVAQVAATWFPTPSGTRAIVAAIVARPGLSLQAQDLYADLATRLPGPMIPARFIFVPWLPMTTSGKVDRKALRETATASHTDQETIAPEPIRRRARSDTERAMAEVWQRMLGVESVAPDDHFFSIGGDSLTAVQMMMEAEALFGVQLPVHLAFEAPTLEMLASRIDAARSDAEEDIGTGYVFPMAGSGEETPLFFCQPDLILARRGLWTVPCPVYAIAYWARGSGLIKARSIEALAAMHLASVKQTRPQGPYRLAGYSFGGLIALEMAQQLIAAGEEVDLLFLLDPMAPRRVFVSGYEAAPVSSVPLRELAMRRARRIAQGPREQGWSSWLSAIISLPESMQRLSVVSWVHYILVNQHLRRPNKASKLLFPRNRWRAFWFSASRLVRHYVARPYDGRALVVFCDDNSRSGEAYKTLLGASADIRKLDSPHLALFRDSNMKRWMGWLTEAIRDRN